MNIKKYVQQEMQIFLANLMINFKHKPENKMK